MKVLLVTAHPEPRSFNFALRERAISVLEGAGFEVALSDLYQQRFDPSIGTKDFVTFPESEPLRVTAAQKHASCYGGYSIDIRVEQDKLKWSDLVVLQFPIWWGSYPAVLKGWIERVLTNGFAYGKEKDLPSKLYLLSVTTGGASDAGEEDSYRERIERMANDVFGYMRWQSIGSYIVHGPSSSDEGARHDMLTGYEKHLRNVLINKYIKGFGVN